MADNIEIATAFLNPIEYVNKKALYHLIHGDCRKVLESFPDSCIDCVITSPPYWMMREYDIENRYRKSMIGSEETPQEYVDNVGKIFHEIKRILTTTGSVWLNMGDKHHNKDLLGMPWRVALAMKEDGWILRNDVIWNHMKGTQSSKDRLRTVHEYIFHFVKYKKYFYDYKKILIKPKKVPTLNNGSIISATGVSGKKYRKQILASSCLTQKEKKEVLRALEDTLFELKNGRIVDFRMTIRGEQRTLHSDSEKISGRAKEIMEKGFYILKSSAEGYMPNDIWNIVPEDEWRADNHFAVFPVELLELPIRATCPENGIVLDPFVGTGSTVVAALKLGRKAIGIDISKKYIKISQERVKKIQTTLDQVL